MVELESVKGNRGSKDYFSGVEETIEYSACSATKTTAKRGSKEKFTKSIEIVSIFILQNFIILFESVKNTKGNSNVFFIKKKLGYMKCPRLTAQGEYMYNDS